MKMVKSLFLGTAAGLVAVSAGQAADLPVKAKPVEYVKVCNLYGAGFYYMPGTDTVHQDRRLRARRDHVQQQRQLYCRSDVGRSQRPGKPTTS